MSIWDCRVDSGAPAVSERRADRRQDAARAAPRPATQPVLQAHWKLYRESGEGLSDAIGSNPAPDNALRDIDEGDDDA